MAERGGLNQEYCYFSALGPQSKLLQEARRKFLQTFPLYLFVLDDEGQVGCCGSAESADMLALLPCVAAFDTAAWAVYWPKFTVFACLSSSAKVCTWEDLEHCTITGQAGNEKWALCLCASTQSLAEFPLPGLSIESLELRYWYSFRSLFALIPEWQQGLLCRAKELLYFDREFVICSCCGQKLEYLDVEFGKQCGSCQALFFPRQDPSVISLIVAKGPVRQSQGQEEQAREKGLQKELRIEGEWLLLAHNYRFRTKMYSLIAGFVEAGEALEQALLREAKEEAGVDLERVQYLRSQAWPHMHSLMAGFWAESCTVPQQSRPDGKEIAALLWLERSDIQAYLREDAKLPLQSKESKPLLYPLGNCQKDYCNKVTAGVAEEAEFCLPDRGTIARKLIEQWAWY